MLKPLPLLAVLAGLAASPVCAADFTGARLEARVGYDHVSIDDQFEDIPDTLDGPAIGGAMGYDWAVGSRFTVGVEAGATLPTDSEETVTLAKDRLTPEAERDLDILFRVGARMSDRALLFAKAGYANSRFASRYDSFVGTGFETEEAHEDEDGLRLGAGVEVKLNERFFATAEYRYTDYRDDVSRSQLFAGVGVRF